MPLAISSGDPAGVGPDLCLLAFAQLQRLGLSQHLVVLASPELLRQRAASLGLPVAFSLYPDRHADKLCVFAVDLQAQVSAGRADPANNAYTFELLHQGHQLASQPGWALVTNPVNKELLNRYRAFRGHTEYLQNLCGCKRVLMLLASEASQPPLRVALLSTHIPLSQVASFVRQDDLELSLNILHQQLRQLWAINAPRIKVAGLNPHAGDSGLLGREELEIISPAIAKARSQGINVVGPLSADSLFHQDNLANTDAFLVMYHDQGLPVLKHYAWHSAINITLGLPYLRVSVDHGTAYELAGSNRIDSNSFVEAIKFADKILAKTHCPRSSVDRATSS